MLDTENGFNRNTAALPEASCEGYVWVMAP